MKKFHLILSIIISLAIIGGAVYRFDVCKASKESVIELAGNFEMYKLEQYRNALQERIWQIQKAFPTNYHTHPEYLRLVEELKRTDKKLDAYYKRGS